jgi:hypothetical protein
MGAPRLSDEELAAINARAEAATPGPWQWVDPETDEPCLPDSPCATGDHGGYAYRLSLRTVEEFPTSWVGPLPRFIINTAEEFYEVEQDDGTWRHPDAAFIAAARTDVPALLAEVERLRAELDTAWLRFT